MTKAYDWINSTWRLDGDESELQHRVDEIVDGLVICWMFFRGPDQAASVAQQRANLHAFRERGDFSWEALDRLDSGTQIAICNQHPGGELDLYRSKDPNAIERAVRAAIQCLGPSERGRSKLSDSTGEAQFALFVARLFRSATGIGPTNTWPTVYEPFREFLCTLIGFFPKQVWPISIDGLAHRAVLEYRKDQANNADRAIQSMCIAESRWLGVRAGN